MNYIELINGFWRLDKETPFAPSDTRLYFYLLDTCNKLGWKNPFGHSDRHLAFNVGMNIKTIRKAKLRLSDAGLIELILPDKPSNSIAGQTKYKLLTVVKNTTVDSEAVVNNTTEDGTNNKQNFLYLTDKDKERETHFFGFQKYVSDNHNDLTKFKKPLTIEQFTALKETHSTDDILKALKKMDNIVDITENYKSMNECLLFQLEKKKQPRKRTPKPKDKPENKTKPVNETDKREI